MPYRKEQLVNGEIYHIVVRGIDENLIFKDIDDYYRGIFSIYEFNTTKSVTIRERRRVRVQIKNALKKINQDLIVSDSRDKLVEVLTFCLMPNHIHLLVRQLKDGGVVKFMLKLCGGYAKYFNLKYKRKGYVFQNRFRAVHIKNDNQLKVVFVYIHVNPVSLIEKNWKEKGIRNQKKAIKFVKEYKWSSCSDYIGKTNFPSVTDRGFVLETVGGEKACGDFIKGWIKYKSRIKKSPELFLE